jgi:hypothetical protein
MSGMVLFAILTIAMLEEEDDVRTSLSIPKSLLLSSMMGLVMVGGFWSASPSIAWEVEAVYQAVNGGVKDWKVSVRNDET